MDWLQKGGADTSKLELKFYNDNYRGILAKCDIKRGEVIMRIPEKQIITLAMAWETPVGQKVSDLELLNKLNSIKHMLLAMFSIQEQHKPKEERKFSEMLDTYPESCNNFPVLYTDEELVYLKGSRFLDVIN